MNNGKSTLFRSLDANILAMIVLLCCTVFTAADGFMWALSLITLCASVVLFFIDANYFVRRCCVQAACISAAGLVLSLLFYLLGLISWTFSFNFFALIAFRIINIIVHLLLAVPALLSCIQAYGGKSFKIPFVYKYIDKLCEKLGVF